MFLVVDDKIKVLGCRGCQIHDIETYCKYLDAVFKNTNLRYEASFPKCLRLPLISASRRRSHPHTFACALANSPFRGRGVCGGQS